MGRPGLTRHRKFNRLARSLNGTIQAGFGAVLARGVLELIWDSAYENGDDFLGDAADVEGAACWGGKDGTLLSALLDSGGEGSGFVEVRCRCGDDRERHESGDACDEWSPVDGRYYIHDLFDHMPEYVERRLKRELARNEKGQTITSMRSAAGKKGATARKIKATGEQPASNRQANGESVANETPSPSDENKQASSNEEAAGVANGAAPAPAPAPAQSASSEADPDTRPGLVVEDSGGGHAPMWGAAQEFRRLVADGMAMTRLPAQTLTPDDWTLLDAKVLRVGGPRLAASWTLERLRSRKPGSGGVRSLAYVVKVLAEMPDRPADKVIPEASGEWAEILESVKEGMYPDDFNMLARCRGEAEGDRLLLSAADESHAAVVRERYAPMLAYRTRFESVEVRP